MARAHADRVEQRAAADQPVRSQPGCERQLPRVGLRREPPRTRILDELGLDQAEQPVALGVNDALEGTAERTTLADDLLERVQRGAMLL
jgi:hypothetical protein